MVVTLILGFMLGLVLQVVIRLDVVRCGIAFDYNCMILFLYRTDVCIESWIHMKTWFNLKFK